MCSTFCIMSRIVHINILKYEYDGFYSSRSIFMKTLLFGYLRIPAVRHQSSLRQLVPILQFKDLQDTYCSYEAVGVQLMKRRL